MAIACPIDLDHGSCATRSSRSTRVSRLTRRETFISTVDLATPRRSLATIAVRSPGCPTSAPRPLPVLRTRTGWGPSKKGPWSSISVGLNRASVWTTRYANSSTLGDAY